MRKEDLFEVLGELDDDVVGDAKTMVKKKMGWRAWGALAACLCLVTSVGAFVFHPHQDGDITIEPGIADVAPMVYVNDTLYKQSSDQQGYPEFMDDFVYLGQILSDIANSQSGNTDGVPKENFQANHPVVGCEVYQYGENIVVKINGAYWLYVKYGGTETNWDELLETEKGQLDPAYKK